MRRWRQACGDRPEPSALVMDSRSCRSAPPCGRRGIDGGKKVKGVTISLAVDKHGIPLAVTVAAANVQDTVAIRPALEEAAAAGFRGTALGYTSYQGDALRTAAQDLGIATEVKVCGAKGQFIPTEIRWSVERSFAWLRSLIAFEHIAFISILACRLSRLETAESLA